MQNNAIQKLTTEFHQLYSACLDASLSHISGEPYLSSFNELPLYQQKMINHVDRSLSTLITYCSKMSKNMSFLENLIKGYDHKTQKFKNSVVVLVSSPYGEPMNYLLNIIWGHININLEHLKFFVIYHHLIYLNYHCII